MRSALLVAVAQPAISESLAANVAAHAALVRAAEARLVVFPELSLTGYRLSAPAVPPDDPVLAPLLEACRAGGAVALLGAPVREGGRDYIAVLRVDDTGARVAYRKRWLGDAERRRFAEGDAALTITVDGWRVGLGICKDAGVDAHVEAMAELDVDLYAAGVVHHAAERPVQDARARRIARRCGAFVALASFAGPTGEGYDATAGASTILDPSGAALARVDAAPGQLARATLR